MSINWRYPWNFGLDTKSIYRSLWLGWWLITWTRSLDDEQRIEELDICFQPGL
jgi:hypothetical protein